MATLRREIRSIVDVRQTVRVVVEHVFVGLEVVLESSCVHVSIQPGDFCTRVGIGFNFRDVVVINRAAISDGTGGGISTASGGFPIPDVVNRLAESVRRRTVRRTIGVGCRGGIRRGPSASAPIHSPVSDGIVAVKYAAVHGKADAVVSGNGVALRVYL